MRFLPDAADSTRSSLRSVNSLLSAVLLVGLAGLMAGCGSSLETTLQKEWQVEAGENARTINVEPQREQLLIGKNKNTTVYDADGTVIYGEDGGGLGSMLSTAVSRSGGTIGSMSANELDYLILSDPGVALIFDYSASDDIIRALDLESQSVRWERTDYRWSLEKYRGAGVRVAQQVAQAAGVTAGLATEALNETITRERFVTDLVVEVPNRNQILLKTVGELRLVDLDTGQTQWTVDDVSGSSIIHAEWLSSGDLVAVMANSSLIGKVTGGQELLRLNPENGRVKWRTDHDASGVSRALVQKDRLLLQHDDNEVEVFNLTDGTEVFEAQTGWKADVVGRVAVEYKEERYEFSLTGGAAIDEAAVYVPQVAETQIVGAPHYSVKKYDRTEGTKVWESDQVKEIRGGLQDLTLADGRLLGRAVHLGGGALGSDPRQYLVGWNVEDGTIAWNQKTPYDFSDAALIRIGPLGGVPPSAWNLVTSEGRAYVATDTSVTAYDIDDGSRAISRMPAVSGQPVWSTKAGNTLVDLRTEGVGFHSLSDLSSAAKPVTFNSELITYEQEGDYLLTRTEKGLYVVDVAEQTLAGTVAQEDGGGLVTGSLRRGFFMTENARSLFVLTPDRIVQKYRLP